MAVSTGSGEASAVRALRTGLPIALAGAAGGVGGAACFVVVGFLPIIVVFGFERRSGKRTDADDRNLPAIVNTNLRRNGRAAAWAFTFYGANPRHSALFTRIREAGRRPET